MSGLISLPDYQVTPPTDFSALLQRQQALQMSRLQMMAAQRQMDQADAFSRDAPALLGALGTAPPEQQGNILAKLAGLGTQGVQVAGPMLREQFQEAGFRRALAEAGMGGGGDTAAQLRDGTLPPVQAAALRGRMPGPLPGEQQPRGFFDRLGAAENGTGDPAARPTFPDGRLRSSAMGNFQFIDGTWLRFAAANPQLFEGLSREQILAARADPRLSRLGAEWYARENLQGLRAAGYGGSAAEVALAHRFGLEDALRLLRSGPDKPLDQVLSAEVLTANPELRGRRAGDVLTQFATRYGGGEVFAGGGGGAGAAAPPSGLPSMAQLARLAQSGNPRALEYVQRMAPLVARETPEWGETTADGRRILYNRRNPAQRIDMGAAGDRVTYQDVTDDAGGIVAQRGSDGSYRPVQTPGMTPAQARRDVFTLGPRVARGEIVPGSPEFDRYVAAYDALSQPMPQWVDDPQQPGTQRLVMVPRTVPPQFPNPASVAGGGGAAPAVAAPGVAPAVAPAEGGVVRRDPHAPDPSRPQSAEAAARIALVREGVRAVDDVSAAVLPARGAGVNRGLLAAIWASAPGTQGAQLRNLIENAIGNRLRIESGANATPEETRRLTERYLPRPWDNEQTVRQKLAGLRSYFSDFEGLTRGGNAAMAPAAAASARPDATDLRNRYGLE